MGKILLYGVLLTACVWCCSTSVQAALKKPTSPVHERRKEENDKRKEVYGLYIKEQVAEEKKAKEAKKTEAERKNEKSDPLKISSAGTLEVVSSANTMDIETKEQGTTGEDARKKKKDQIDSKTKKASGPKVITIDPQK